MPKPAPKLNPKQPERVLVAAMTTLASAGSADPPADGVLRGSGTVCRVREDCPMICPEPPRSLAADGRTDIAFGSGRMVVCAKARELFCTGFGGPVSMAALIPGGRTRVVDPVSTLLGAFGSRVDLMMDLEGRSASVAAQ